MKNKAFKITSRFYVIYGDYVPIYVGYTNRTVKQRFKEHKEDKDFSEYENVEVKELIDEKLNFNFTWDYEKTCKNADEVSLRESQLVQKYGTQDSIFQKADGGGQTWAAEKGFVKNNKDNPRFTGMSGAEIKEYLSNTRVSERWLYSFVGNINPVEKVWIGHFVSTMVSPEEQWLHGFISTMVPVEKRWIVDFVNHMKPTKIVWLGGFVSTMVPVEESWLHTFVNTMRPIELTWIEKFTADMMQTEEAWLKNFVSGMVPEKKRWVHNFVSNMKPLEERWLNDFVGSMKNKRG